jgi:SAM-dependent methyltransferase
MPTNSCLLLARHPDAIACRRGELILTYCEDCAFLHNAAFDPALSVYGLGYEATQAFSPTFAAYHRELALDLMERYAVRRGRVVEIGCGQGEFLALFAELGDNSVLGFDPCYTHDRSQAAGLPGMRILARDFGPGDGLRDVDLVCCKMTLEHIREVRSFVGRVRDALGDNRAATVFFQVPDATRLLTDAQFCDLPYEHCSYFVPDALAGLLARSGFEVLEVRRGYEGQHLSVEARAITGPRRDRAATRAVDPELGVLVEGFRRRVEAAIEYWRRFIERRARRNETVVIWGSGSKATMFLNLVPGSEVIRVVVDINPHRQGSFTAGSGQEIVAPRALRDLRPDSVVVMNPIYEAEIRETLRALELCPEVAVVAAHGADR